MQTKDKNQLFVLGIRSVDYEIQTFRPELHRDIEIEAALWQEVEEAREAELAEKLNEPETDEEPTAEAPAQESSVEPTKPEAAEVVEIKLTTYNPKKFVHAPVCLNPKVSIKVGIRRPTPN